MYKPKILVVEDDPAITNLMRTTLDTQEYQYHTARTGSGALLDAVSYNPDVIILDLGLPDMDGVDIIRKIRGWSEMPIIVVSARSEDQDKVEALDAGADDYLTKPFSIDELLDRNLSSGITLQDVAAHVYLSPNHLSRLFKEAAGETFSKYAIKHKIEHAKRMLLSSSSKVCDIGAQIGYRDTHYFIRVFKAYTGMSPAEYRRNMRLMEVEKR